MELLHSLHRQGAYRLLIVLGGLMATALAIAQSPSASPHQIEVIANGDGYTFSTTNLALNDRVFYRFSDGHYLIAQNSESNHGAAVSRSFPNSASIPPKVIGYVAKKNGPLGIAYLDPGAPELSFCSGCAAPEVGLAPDEYIRIENSWMPFTETEGLSPFVDNTTAPAFTTPGQPWLLLAVTMKALPGATEAEVSFPTGFSFAGSIVDENWGTGPALANTFVQSVTAPASGGGKVLILLAPGVPLHQEFTVFLLLSGNTGPGMNTFNAQLKDARKMPLASGILRLTTSINPHDPNRLTAFESYTCAGRSDNPPLRYRVDFQNLGEGVAHDVKVEVQMDPAVLKLSTVSNISASGGDISHNFVNNAVSFYLKDINLPGIGQSPQPSLKKTLGWIEFSIGTQDCISPESDAFFSVGYVTFIAKQNGKIYFEEMMRTNRTHQKVEENCPEDPLCLKSPGKGGEGRASAPIASQQPAEPRCYPTLVTDHLTLEAPAAPENGMIRIAVCDLAGKQWLEISQPVTSGEAYRQQVETAHLPAGMYLVHFQFGGQPTVFKIVKNKI